MIKKILDSRDMYKTAKWHRQINLQIHVLLRSVTDRKLTLLRSVIDRNPFGSDDGKSSDKY